jgi:hypothetical protein
MLRSSLARVTVAALSALALLAGCGGASDEQQVRDTLAQFEKATAKQDYRTVCNKLLARQLLQRLQSVGLPCEVALQTGLGSVRQPRLKVHKVRIRGTTALAQVTSTAAGQQSATDTIRLLKEDGDWRLTALSAAQPPTPRKHPGD